MLLLAKLLIIIIVNYLFCSARKLEIKDMHEDPVVLTKLNKCKIQTGSIRIIHLINLTNLEFTVELITKNVVDKIDKDKLELYSIVKQKSKTLYNNLLQIKPPKSLRRKRWDTLGTAWKWVAGNPDANDLRIINTTINELINENNQQFQVNERINKRIQLLTNTINEVITSTTVANRVALTELEIITSIMHIDTINKILEDIQDAIIRTKVALPSNKILSLKEIIAVKNMLNDQGVNITIPDEALKFITPKIAINEETLLYLLEIPKLEDETSTVIRVIPLNVNNSIIENYPQYLIKNKQKLFTTTNYNTYVQKHSEIKEFKDNCIKPLIMGNKSTCNVTVETDTTVQWISEGRILINNAKNIELSTNCGPDNRNLTGNILVNIWNCTAVISGKKFQSYEIEIENEEIIGALYNIQMFRQMTVSQNITAIGQETFRNRKQLDHIHLKQYNHQNWLRILSGGISTSSICIFLLVLYMTCKNKHLKRQKSKNAETTVHVKEMSYNRLLREAGVKTKVEDDFSSPQGGVTVTVPTETAMQTKDIQRVFNDKIVKTANSNLQHKLF